FIGDRLAHPDAVPRVIAAAMDLRARLLSRFRRFAPAIAAGIILVVAVYSPRMAVAALATILALGMSPALQFQARHVFHLELLSLSVMGICIRVPSMGPWTRTGVVRAGAVGAAFLVLAAVPLIALREIQQRSATALLATYEAAQTVPIAMAPDGSGGLLADAR